MVYRVWSRQTGLSLLENLLLLLTVVAILLAAGFVRQRWEEQARIVAATQALHVAQSEQLARTHAAPDAPCRYPPDTKYFAMRCSSSAGQFTLSAHGMGEMAGFVYRIDSHGHRTSLTPWRGAQACWVLQRNTQC